MFYVGTTERKRDGVGMAEWRVIPNGIKIL